MIDAILMAAALAALPAEGPADCAPVPGWSEMLAHAEPRFVVVGEMHGNAESPRLFLDLVCAASKRGPVTVALEQDSANQPKIDAFLQSDGSGEARARFLASAIWQSPFKDGRSSEATFALFDGLRALVRAGRVGAVTAFRPAPPEGPYDPAATEKAMASLVERSSRPGALTLVLTGNVHAMRTPVPFGSKYLPMAAHLPRDETVTLDVVATGGESWACSGRPVECGPMKIGRTTTDWRRGIVLSPDEDEPYSGAIHLGVPTTASPPAVPAAETQD